MMQTLYLLVGAFLFGGYSIVAFTPLEPKRMKSNFADFIMRSDGYGPKFTCSKGGTGTTSVLMPVGNLTEYRNFYEILGVGRDDDIKEIKQEYRKRAKMYHPDINPDNDAIDLFQEINRAYEVLRDPELRKAYDWFGEHGIGTSFYSDDINSQEAEGFEYDEEITFGEISSSFKDCLDPRGSRQSLLKKERPKARKKRRYTLYHLDNFKSNKFEKKEETPGSKRKGKHAFAHVHNPQRKYRNMTP